MRALAITQPAGGHSGIFAECAEEERVLLNEWCPATSKLPPRPVDEYGALVVLGGAMNVHQIREFPWLGEEMSLIGQMLRRRVPVFGVCLGAQLLARSAGGRVARASRPEIGWHEVRPTPAARRDILFSPLPERFLAYQWHSYSFRLPASAVGLADSSVCPQAYRLGDAAWGVQFHPEVTEDILEEWFADYEADDDAVRLNFDPARAAQEMSEHLPFWKSLGRTMFQRFLSFSSQRSQLAEPAARFPDGRE